MTLGCSEIRDLIHPFLDGELEVDKNVSVLKHFELCTRCEARKEAERKLQVLVAEAVTEPVGSGTRSRIMVAAFARATGGRVDCADVHDLVHPFLDGELEVDRNVELLGHLEQCGPCKAHSETERKLTATVVAAATEPVDEVTRARIFKGAWDRYLESSDEVSALPEGHRSGGRLRIFAAAAGLLLAVSAGYLGYADPFCWGGCATGSSVGEVYVASLNLPLVDPQTIALEPPAAPMPCIGCSMVATPGVAKRPVWTYRCEETGKDVKYLEIPGGHVHTLALKEYKDGRRYFQKRLPDGSQLVGWQAKTGVSCCIAPGDMPTEALFVLATGIRDKQQG